VIKVHASPARYPSAEVIAPLALERQTALLQQADALDSKAATLVGLIGVLLGLLFSSGFVLDRWNFVLSLGTGLLVVAAAVLAIGVFFPRRYLLNPDVRALSKRFISRQPEDTLWAITQSVNRALPQIQRVLSRKAFLVGTATLLLVAALGLIGGRLIYSIENLPVDSANAEATDVNGTRR
jgi:hypothetical protein